MENAKPKDTIIKMDHPNLFRYDEEGMWSDRRKNLVFDTAQAYTMWIRCRFTNMALGSAPNDADIYATHIGKNAPDALTLRQEIEAIGLSNVEDRGITVFPRGTFLIRPDGTYVSIGGKFMKDHPEIIDAEVAKGSQVMVLPAIKGYQWKGSFKESIQMLRQAAKDRSGTAKPAVKRRRKKTDQEVSPEVGFDQTEISAMNGTTADDADQKPAKRRGRPKKKPEFNDDDDNVNVVAAALSDADGNIIRPEIQEKITRDDRQSHFNEVYDRRYACADITAYKKVIDGTWFVDQPMIPIFVPEYWYDDLGERHNSYNEDGRLCTFSRALRADTAQGPRQAIACSEYVPVGSEFYFSVTLMNKSDLTALIETLD